MAHANLETSTWLPSNARHTADQEQHAMLDHSDIQWTDEYGADALFSNSSNYELCQESLLSPGKTGLQMGSYFDMHLLNEPGFEGWNNDNSSLVQPRTMPELDLSAMGQSSNAYPPSAFHTDAKSGDGSHQAEDITTNATLLDMQSSVVQENSLRAHQEGLMLDLGSPALPVGYANELRSLHRHSPTPMLSDFGGDHEERFDYEEMEEDNEKPYAQLIYQALLTAKDYSMQLQDIYDWIEHSTDKVKDKSGHGWKNSIRHNLSMNKVRLIPQPNT